MDNNDSKKTVTIFRLYQKDYQEYRGDDVHKLVYYFRDDIPGRLVRKEHAFPNREAFMKCFYKKL